MELERMNLEGDPEAQEEEEEEKRGGRRGCSACVNCDKIHASVSKWMLPEDVRGTYLERANCIPPPIFIITISVAELAVFIYYAVWKPQTQWITLETGISESPLTYSPDKRKQAWRFLSYMLVHAGVEHIMGNLLLQLFLGIPLELVHKGHRVGLVYLAGVIGGSLASSICDPLQALVGASGGVYALIGGYFMNILVNFREMIPMFGLARLLVILSIVGTDVGFAFYRRYLPAVTGPRALARYSSLPFPRGVSLGIVKACVFCLQPSLRCYILLLWVHCVKSAVERLNRPLPNLGGALSGFAGMSIGYVIFSSFDQNFLKDPRFWVSIVGYLAFLGFAVFYNVFFSPANV